MTSDAVQESSPKEQKRANHICVLVHGLWGNHNHLKYITDTLRERYSEDELIILACKKNASSFTYDGIEIGGERVAREIEETVESLKREGCNITRFSIVGYSLGGLIARYAIGLLDQRGYFEHITPVTFTSFASPHLGVRTPLLGYANHLWNVLGARTLSASGRQLFAIDNFRDTGRPLLSVLADPDSIFIHALAQFERRVLYANIVNDRSAVFYTTGVSRVDPYTQLDQLKLNYLPGYGDVLLDPDLPCEPKQEDEALPSFYKRFTGSSSTFFQRAPIYLALTIFMPLGVIAFLVNSSIQTFRSRRRIMLHETNSDGQDFAAYRIPYMVREVRAGLEDAFGVTNATQEQEYLPQGSEEAVGRPGPHRASISSSDGGSRQHLLTEKHLATTDNPPCSTSQRGPDFPTLALTQQQFAMIDSLDACGFRKYPVHIHLSRHSHAAIIVRMPSRSAFAEGKIVVKHWLDQEFKI